MLKAIRHGLLFCLALLLFIEEWLWDVLSALGGWLASLLRLARWEERLARSSRWVALLAFLLPVLALIPLNGVIFLLLARGLVLQAIGMEIVLKLSLTLVVSRIFALTRSQLLSFAGFAWLYGRVMAALRWAHDRLRQTLAYQHAMQWKARIIAGAERLRERVQSFIRQ